MSGATGPRGSRGMARACTHPRPPLRRASRQQPKHGADAAPPTFMKVVHAGGVHIRALPDIDAVRVGAVLEAGAEFVASKSLALDGIMCVEKARAEYGARKA